MWRIEKRILLADHGNVDRLAPVGHDPGVLGLQGRAAASLNDARGGPSLPSDFIRLQPSTDTGPDAL